MASITVEIGTLSSVDPAALRSAFGVACRHTGLQEAKLKVDVVGPVVWCDHCQSSRPLADGRRLRCPSCGQRCPRLLKGDELGITRIELVAGEETDAHDRSATDPASHP